MITGARKRKDVAIRLMAPGDVPEVRELARAVWSDQLLKDTGIAVDYPAREEKVYSAYIEAEPDGNLVAEAEGKLIGASYAHAWGSVGWIGPIEVDARWQGKGVGTALMKGSESYLGSKGCSVIGVETMGESSRNNSFYRSLGYSVHTPTFVYEKDLDENGRLSGLTESVPPERCESYLPHFAVITDSIFPGMDIGNEFRMTCSGGLGKVLIFRDPMNTKRILGASIVHERTVEGMSSHLLRALIVDPNAQGRESVFSSLLNDSEVVASSMGARKLFFTSSVNARSVISLADRNYKVIGNNVKMLRSGTYGEKGDFQLISWAG